MPNLDSRAAEIMEPVKVTRTYTIVTCIPRSESKRAMITGLRTGEEKRNAMVGPKGTPPLSRPAVIGTVEQEQKGVTAPRPAPKRYCTQLSLLDRKSLTRDGGRYSMSIPMIKDTATNMSTSSPAITRKNFPAVMKLFRPSIVYVLS